MAVFTAKIPVAIATGIVGFVLGGGLVGVVMSYTLVKPDQQVAAAPGGDDEKGSDPKGGKGGVPGAPGVGGGGGGKGGKGGGGGGKGGGKGGGGGGGGGLGGGGGGGGGAPGGPKGPSSKAQLAQLVNKLDTLTKKPLSVELTADQKKQTKELLAGLESAEDLKEEDAKNKLDALLKLFEGNKQTLEAAGYRWPGGGGGGMGGGGMGGMPPPNPFKGGDGADRLKSLQSTLER
ncbi:hypothetical protein J8F10_29320 [Gemmata sp. G18]|uniref:Uncharacterized protein n=1 Tax=Gemmata palustris TaxID=2822762 RepID=A0ABS5C071_9BACT|nr:hypothetical protein [Gemmata palustris]MBP3959366.1 hypothetical protein [Gemmata palustris]